MNNPKENRICQNCKAKFEIEPEDFNFYEKIKVPPPTFCPECRAIRRLIWRNERSLYHNTCAFSGKKLISMFSPETNLVVYDRDIWWSDKWDPTVYGQDYDFSRPFFEQFRELLSRVPLANLGNTNNVNSEYGNHNADLKNCYLVFASVENKNVSYARGVFNTQDSFDLYAILKSEQCYDDVSCSGLYNTHFSYDSDDSINSYFLTACMNLQDCLGCVNLRHKTHCIFNTQYTKEEYEKKLAGYDFGSYKNLLNFTKEYKSFLSKQPRRYANILKSVNVTGDNVLTSKNCKEVFDIFGETEDSKHIVHGGLRLKDSYDSYGIGARAEFLYECVDAGLDASTNLFTILTHQCLQVRYTYMCYGSSNLFGCIGIRNKKYCILNKEYSKEEYENLLPKIIKQMSELPYVDGSGRLYKYGEFFPMEMSPFFYNETILEEYYPLNKKEIAEYGLKLKEKTERNYVVEVKTEDLPDHIKDTPDSIVGKVIECMHKGSCNEQCTEAFKVRIDELQFLKKNNIALPRLCPNCRHFQRIKRRNPMKLWHRKCMCGAVGSPSMTAKHNHIGECEVEFETSYAPDRDEIIYCEKCYQAEVY